MDNTYLKRIRQTWYVQMRVPRKLSSIVGKQQLLKSTKTRDITVARRRRHAIVADFQQLIEAARALHVSDKAGLIGDLQNEAALLRRQIQAGHVSREDDLEEWHLMLDKLYDLPPGTTTPAESQAIRDAGETLRHPKVHLSDAIESYLSDNPSLRPSTIKERRTRLTAFMNWLGDKPLDAITRPEAGQYVSEVLQPKGLAVATIRQVIGDIASFFRFCIARGLSTSLNPFEGMSKSVRDTSRGTADKTQAKLRAWTMGELVKLLNGTTGNLTVMSVLALYTGCRENELAEAKLEDVHDTHLYIPEAKSVAGIRSVPWHPMVKPLVEQLEDTSDDGYLVSGLKRGGYDDKRHHLFAKRFSYHKNKLGLPSSVVFHGLRKNLITQLVQHQVPTHEVQQLVGHTADSLVHTTYSEGVSLERLTEIVGMVDYGKDVTGAVRRALSGIIE